MNLHLDHFRYLRAVATAPSWQAAAKLLHRTPAAVSQALGEVEHRLGVSLFVRVGRRKELTAAGRELLGFAEHLLALAEHMEERLAVLSRGGAGVLRLGVIDAVCMQLLPGALGEYRRERAGVEVRVVVGTSDELLARLRQRELDLVVVVGPIHEPHLESRLVAREALHIARRAGDRREPREVPWLLYPRGSHTRQLIDQALARRGITPRVALESHQPAVLAQMVNLGLGWSVLPADVWRGPRRRRGIEATPLLTRDLTAAWRGADVSVTAMVEVMRRRASASTRA